MNKKGACPMKGYSGRDLPAAFSRVLPAVLLFCLCPFFAAAQTGEASPERQTEERIDTGRFGAEEPPEEGGGGNGLSGKWLYLGLRVGPSLRFYTPEGDTPHTGGDTRGFSLDTALQAAVEILPFLSIQGEAVFTWDNASRWDYVHVNNYEVDRYTWEFTAFSLQFPLIVKLNFYPGKFRLSPFFGAYYLVPLGKLKFSNTREGNSQSSSYRVSVPFGLLGGVNGAYKLGPGMIFADLRYAADLGRPELKDGALQTYKRGMISLTVGYELGFFTKTSRNGGSHE
jgi:hypothetical protein